MADFLTTSEAAEIMRLSRKRVAQLCESGAIVARRTGGSSGHWRIYRDKFMQAVSLPPDDLAPPLDPEIEEIDWSIFERIKQQIKSAS